MTQITILIADDHPIVREGLRGVLNLVPEIAVVGEAADGVQAVDRALALQPDIVLLDLLLPYKDGIQVIAEIKRVRPAIRILVLSSFADNDQVLAALRMGAEGYMLKEASPDMLIHAIHDIYQGRAWLDPTIAPRVIHEMDQSPASPAAPAALTARELEVLKLVARGLSNTEIAKTLFISESTVRVHVSHILGKLHLANRIQAALYAVRKGIIDLED